jgi:hypothetical protein
VFHHRRGCLFPYERKILAAADGKVPFVRFRRRNRYASAMGRRVDVDALIDAQDVAAILGLAHRNTVSEYQARYPEMPRPVVDRRTGRLKLWLRPEVERWAAQHRKRVAGRGRPRLADSRP